MIWVKESGRTGVEDAEEEDPERLAASGPLCTFALALACPCPFAFALQPNAASPPGNQSTERSPRTKNARAPRPFPMACVPTPLTSRRTSSTLSRLARPRNESLHLGSGAFAGRVLRGLYVSVDCMSTSLAQVCRFRRDEDLARVCPPRPRNCRNRRARRLLLGQQLHALVTNTSGTVPQGGACATTDDCEPNGGLSCAYPRERRRQDLPDDGRLRRPRSDLGRDGLPVRRQGLPRARTSTRRTAPVALGGTVAAPPRRRAARRPPRATPRRPRRPTRAAAPRRAADSRSPLPAAAAPTKRGAVETGKRSKQGRKGAALRGRLSFVRSQRFFRARSIATATRMMAPVTIS